MTLEHRGYSGNVVRRFLEEAGIRRPNRELIDVIAPAILTDAEGGTLREWKYASAEIRPIMAAMKMDFEELESLRGDEEAFQIRLQEVKTKFYGLLNELDDGKAAGKFKE